jgi:hypothetical protein
MVDATDDYYGAATVGDDEYAQFNKVVVDSIITSETRYVYATKILSDQFTSVDSKAAAVTKTLVDILSITAVDYISRDPSKGLQDTTTTSETKTFNVGKYLVDITTTSENKYFNVAKYLAHVAATSEQLTRAVNKALLDSTTSIPESANFIVGKYSADTTNRSDTQQSSIQPKQFETVSSIESKAANSGKALADTLTITSIDYITRLPNKVLQDTTTTSETKYLQFQKYFTDSVSKSDTITTANNYLRSFQDMVDATDDYYGAATAGDDEYAQFNKVVVDTAITTETKYAYATKILSDQITSVDSKAVNLGKTLVDTLTITSIDYITRIVNKALQDITTTSESKTFGIGKYFADIINKADTQQSSIQPKQFETVRFADVLTFLKSGGYNFTDSIHSTDSGTINNQNYFASSYVTPGYAGTNVTFGT